MRTMRCSLAILAVSSLLAASCSKKSVVNTPEPPVQDTSKPPVIPPAPVWVDTFEGYLQSEYIKGTRVSTLTYWNQDSIIFEIKNSPHAVANIQRHWPDPGGSLHVTVFRQATPDSLYAEGHVWEGPGPEAVVDYTYTARRISAPH